jgi:NTE family protein
MTRPRPCEYAPQSQLRTVLYMGPEPAVFGRLVDAMAQTEGARRLSSDTEPVVAYLGTELQWLPAYDTAEAVAMLESMYVNLVVLDVRWQDDFEARVAEVRRLLTELDHEEDIEQRYGFHRIVALVSGPDAKRVDTLIVELGATGVRHVLRDSGPTGAAGSPRNAPLSERLLQTAWELTRTRKVGKTALCASGGGITGIYFEMGVLKCIDDCLLDASVNDFDMMFGISAGAVVTSLLSVGYTVDEAMASFAGVPGGRMPEVTLSLLRLSHLNLEGMGWRLASAMRSGVHALWDVLRGRGRESAESLFLEYTSLVGPPFHSAEFEVMLRNLFDAAGSDNDFRSLPLELYIGASDQDARRHVLFGADRHDTIPVSKAVQASLSVNPAFSAVQIDGRFYEDGAITRTSDFADAVERGATLVFTLDPFVPYVSERPGVAHRRGVLYNIDQDIRTMSFTRFERQRNSVLRKNPGVSSYTILPSNTLRQLLSMNPMDHRPYLRIWRGAYLSSLRRIHQLCHRLQGDLAEHGMTIDTSRADTIAEQLRNQAEPKFEDFFLDRQVKIRTRPFMQSRQRPDLVSTRP